MNASNVFTRLWVGGEPPADRDLPDFDLLVLCAEEIQPTYLPFHGRVLRCPIPDGPLDTVGVARVLITAQAVSHALSVGQRVLVTCAQGINRSALVASLALAHVTRASADDLVRLMRAKRHPQCLCNPHFQRILHHLVGAGRAPRR